MPNFADKSAGEAFASLCATYWKKNPQNFNMVRFSWQYLLHILFLVNQECCCFWIKNQVYFSANCDPAKKLHNKHIPLNNHSVSARRQIQVTNNAVELRTLCERRLLQSQSPLSLPPELVAVSRFSMPVQLWPEPLVSWSKSVGRVAMCCIHEDARESKPMAKRSWYSAMKK